MEKFTTLTGVAAYLPIDNIDTDMLIPKQYLKTIKRSGLGAFLFAEQRYDDQGNPLSDFVLNQKPESVILIAGDNFGCGSSREHAPWALLDFGIRTIIAPGFADIFYNNCFKNGILPVILPQTEIDKLLAEGDRMSVNLESQNITSGDVCVSFDIESYRKDILLKGLDDINKTLQHRNKIEAFEKDYFEHYPWLGKTHA